MPGMLNVREFIGIGDFSDVETDRRLRRGPGR